MKYVLGLTGPTGAGKTTLCKAAQDMDFLVINCDLLARRAVEQQDCLDALERAFSKDILDKDGRLDRKALAQKAFINSEKTELLNKTILPFIVKHIEEEIVSSEKSKIILDAPTLYESGADRLCDAVCAVLSDKGKRILRIMARDNITEDEALLRINAGKTDEYYTSKTENIIYNDGITEDFVREFKNLLNSLIGGKLNG
ncbi:MAG: dephospho-CoA kinase [Clostridia bacterium]|nr:dephospho-CoA kinase [Clostridia bacterium]